LVRLAGAQFHVETPFLLPAHQDATKNSRFILLPHFLRLVHHNPQIHDFVVIIFGNSQDVCLLTFHQSYRYFRPAFLHAAIAFSSLNLHPSEPL
jgi:hypothetical protein